VHVAAQIAAEHASIVAGLQAQLKEAQRGAGRLGDRAKAAGQAAAAAEYQREEMASQLEQLRWALLNSTESAFCSVLVNVSVLCIR
jgi:hypothetical protein